MRIRSSRLAGLAFAASVLFVALGCDSMDGPQLERREKVPVDKLVLLDRLDAKEVRKLFLALNSNGQINSLAKFFDRTGTEELTAFGDLISDYVRVPSTRRHVNLREILDKRLDQGSFAGKLAEFRAKGEQEPYIALRATFAQLTQSAEGLRFLERAGAFFHRGYPRPRFGEADPAKIARKPTPLQLGYVLRDSARALRDGVRSKELLASLGELSQLETGGALLSLLSSSEYKRPEELGAFGDGLSILFKSLTQDLNVLAKDGEAMKAEPKLLAKLLGSQKLPSLFHGLEGSFPGLLTIPQAKIKDDPEVRQGIIDQMRGSYAPFITETLWAKLGLDGRTGYSEKKFWQTHGQNDQLKGIVFRELLAKSLAAVQEMTGQVLATTDAEWQAKNLSILLPSIALARWWHFVIHDSWATWDKIDPVEKFAENLAKSRLSTSKGFLVDFAVEQEIEVEGDVPGGPRKKIKQMRLSPWAKELIDENFPSLKKEPGKNSPEDFTAYLDEGIRKGEIRSTKYTFEQVKDVPLFDAWLQAVTAADNVRSMGSNVPQLQVLLSKVSGGSAGIVLPIFEKQDLLVAVQKILAGVPPEAWPWLRQLLFDSWKLGSLGSNADPARKNEARDLILNKIFVGNEHAATRDRLVLILDGLAAFEKWESAGRDDKAEAESPFSFFHRFIHSLSVKGHVAIAKLFRWARADGVFAIASGKASDAKWGLSRVYVAVHGRYIADKLARMEPMTRQQSKAFLIPFERLFCADEGDRYDPVPAWMAAANAMDAYKGVSLAGEPLNFKLLADSLYDMEDPLEAIEKTYTPDERAWLERFLSNGDLTKLMLFLRGKAGTRSASEFFAALRALNNEHKLKPLLEQILNLKDDSMRSFAKTLLRMHEQGALGQAIDTLESLLTVPDPLIAKPLSPPPVLPKGPMGTPPAPKT